MSCGEIHCQARKEKCTCDVETLTKQKVVYLLHKWYNFDTQPKGKRGVVWSSLTILNLANFKWGGRVLLKHPCHKNLTKQEDCYRYKPFIVTAVMWQLPWDNWCCIKVEEISSFFFKGSLSMLQSYQTVRCRGKRQSSFAT